MRARILVIVLALVAGGAGVQHADAADRYQRLANPALRQAAAVTDAHIAAWRGSSHHGALAGHCSYRAVVAGATAIVTVTCGWSMGAIARDQHGAWTRLA